MFSKMHVCYCKLESKAIIAAASSSQVATQTAFLLEWTAIWVALPVKESSMYVHTL